MQNGSGATPSQQLPPSAAHAVADLVAIQPGGVVSRTLRKGRSGTLTVFAFDAGQELSEHSAPFDAFVQVVEGRADLVIGGETVTTKSGEMVLMPANVPHAVLAPEPMKMLLVMFRDAVEPER
jgi:quercetin dioxygenase-like cupin family protein